MLKPVPAPPQPDPPPHLSPAMRDWWGDIVAEFVLEGHHLTVLQLAAEAFDRNTAAREIIAEQGMMIQDRFGADKPHPMLVVERDARLAHARLVRELGLEGTPEVQLPARGRVS